MHMKCIMQFQQFSYKYINYAISSNLQSYTCHSFLQFHTHHTWTFLVQFKPTGTVFNSPKNITVGCPWTAHSSHIGSTLWNRNPWPNSASYTPNHELNHNLSHKAPKQSIHCHGLSKRVPKNFHTSVLNFGTDQTTTHGLNQLKHLQNT